MYFNRQGKIKFILKNIIKIDFQVKKVTNHLYILKNNLKLLNKIKKIMIVKYL